MFVAKKVAPVFIICVKCFHAIFENNKFILMLVRIGGFSSSTNIQYIFSKHNKKSRKRYRNRYLRNTTIS